MKNEPMATIFSAEDTFVREPRAHFARQTTLEEDIEELINKWKGYREEVFVHQMKDSLIIFKHNLEQYNEYWSIKEEMRKK